MVELTDAMWRKASRSTSNGGECIELAHVTWRKASRSTSNGGQCVEIADVSDFIALRDSKDPDGPALLLTRDGFRELTRSIRGDGS